MQKGMTVFPDKMTAEGHIFKKFDALPPKKFSSAVSVEGRCGTHRPFMSRTGVGNPSTWHDASLLVTEESNTQRMRFPMSGKAPPPDCIMPSIPLVFVTGYYISFPFWFANVSVSVRAHVS